MKFEAVRKVALSLDNVTEGTSCGTSAFFAGRSLFVRWRPDIGALVLKADFDRRREMMDADPDTYFITDHYLNYEWVLVRLARVTPDTLPDLLRMAWKAAGSKREPSAARKATISPKRASTKRSAS